MFRPLLPGFLLLLSFVAHAQSRPYAPDERVYYGLINRGSGRCLDVLGGGAAPGAKAVQWEFTHAASQQWRFVPLRAGSEYYRLEVRHSGQCLTVDKPGEGGALVQRPFSGQEQQQWRVLTAGPAGSYYLENKAEGRVAALVAADKFNGTPAAGQKPGGRASQQWRLFRLRLNVDAGAPAFGRPAPLAGLNTPGNDFGAVLAPDGQTLFFTRTKWAGNTEGNTDSGDAWVSRSPDRGQTWAAPQRLDGVNTPQDNAVAAVVAGGNTLLLRGTYDRDGSFHNEGLSRVSRAAATASGATAKSSGPVAVPVANYYAALPNTSFYLTPDEKLLLLSLERGDSEGGNDLYLSRADGRGGFGEPHSLGGVLNSPGFDFAPWLAPDGKTLYFASFGHMGYGQADIFVSTRLDDSWTRWTEPRNLGPGLNGPGNQAYFSLSGDGKTAYFASSPTATGNYDLYRAAPPLPDSLPRPVAAVSENNRAFLSGRVLEAGSRAGVANATVTAVLLPNAQNVDFRATSTTDGTGGYQLSLLAGRYRLQASNGLRLAADTLAVAGNAGHDFTLRGAAVGSKVDLPSIIFAQGKAGLLAPSYAELNRLALALQADPKIEIRLEGHTDNVGPADKNQQLSEDRVLEVKRYLTGRGVAENRITTVGFGGSKPKFDNEREETRKLNRRVELVIVK